MKGFATFHGGLKTPAGQDYARTKGKLLIMHGTADTLIDISGGTYFPGAKSASDNAGGKPYFIEFAKAARQRTKKPLMVINGLLRS